MTDPDAPDVSGTADPPGAPGAPGAGGAAGSGGAAGAADAGQAADAAHAADVHGVDPDLSTPPPTGRDPLRGSRAGRAWVGVVALAVVLVLLVIFIAQNTRSVTVSFLGWDGHTPLAVALLIAAVAALFVAAVAGSLRIWQLRARVRRAQKRRPSRAI
jgi:uncharacterized integral membrane protein